VRPPEASIQRVKGLLAGAAAVAIQLGPEAVPAALVCSFTP
jgi:hypothetical protein